MVNLIFIGPPKSGSTWLFELFKSHPQIYIAPSKETYYFDKNYEKGLDWYFSHFSPMSEKWISEISHDYIYNRDVASRIKGDLGDVRIMVFLRDPVDWVRSSYLFAKRNGMFSGDIRQFLKERPETFNLKYGTMLQPYLEAFGRENLLVYMYDDLASDSGRFAQEIFKDLGVDDISDLSVATEKVNVASKPRIKLIAKIVKLLAKKLRALGFNKIIGLVKSIPGIRAILYKEMGNVEKMSALDEDAINYLRGAFYDEVVLVDDVLGTKCVERWGYE